MADVVASTDAVEVVPPEFDEEAMTAALDLLGHTSAQGFTVTDVVPGVWVAQVMWKGAPAVGEGPDPLTATLALLRLVVADGVCRGCGRPVMVGPKPPPVARSGRGPRRCVYFRVGDRYVRACEVVAGRG